MGRSRKCATMAAVFLLVLALGEARILSGGGDPPSSSAVQHGSVVPELLNITAWTNAAERARRITAPSECSSEAVVVSQSGEGLMPDGIPSFTVTVTNTCLDCTVRDVHLSCGEFASTELVSPRDFRRLAVGDCLVRDGRALGPGDSVNFEYSNSFPYDLDVASVSCG